MTNLHQSAIFFYLLLTSTAKAFLFSAAVTRPISSSSSSTAAEISTSFITTCLSAKSTKKKKKKSGAGSGGGGGSVAAGIKGFGTMGISTTSSSSSGNKKFETDRSAQARAFYDSLEQQGAGDNFKRCALGYFPLATSDVSLLRGVVALRDLKKGETIVRIPYEVAVNLGQEGTDPTLPALEILKDYCRVLGGGDGIHDNNSHRKAYYTMLPPFRGDDSLGSTDFFSQQALDALQAPLVVKETLHRRERSIRRFEQDIATDDNFPSWIDGTPVTEEHLQWAVWLITSRVLTVQGDAEEGKSYRLLIPFLDMCNHDRTSPHVLTGRAVPGGELKVVAGANIKAGEQVNICYGGGVAGNDRFIQDYGFLDASKQAYELVAQQLLGKRRLLEGASAGKTITEVDREATLKALRSTTMAEDAKLLETTTDITLRTAIEFRLAVKQALSKQIVVQ